MVTVEGKAILFVSATTYVPYSGTHRRHVMLDTVLLASGSPDFPKFQTKNNAYKNPEQFASRISFCILRSGILE